MRGTITLEIDPATSTTPDRDRDILHFHVAGGGVEYQHASVFRFVDIDGNSYTCTANASSSKTYTGGSLFIYHEDRGPVYSGFALVAIDLTPHQCVRADGFTITSNLQSDGAQGSPWMTQEVLLDIGNDGVLAGESTFRSGFGDRHYTWSLRPQREP